MLLGRIVRMSWVALAFACDGESSRGVPPLDAMASDAQLPPEAGAGSLDSGMQTVADSAVPMMDASSGVDARTMEPLPDASQDARVTEDAALDARTPADDYDHLSPGEGLSSDPLCDQIEACGGDIAVSYRVICGSRLGDRVTEACFAAVQSAPCSDHAIENPPYMEVCHPRCDDFQTSWCNDDLTRSSCFIVPEIVADEGVPRWITSSCTRICELGGSVAVDCRQVENDGQCVCEDDL